ncbi:MAG: sulfurtransferase TusA family protein [Syntrophomonadaceae bacterium]|nr:sulfurtransferase TusA family protein [Syntrophomonadaceae bacterium]
MDILDVRGLSCPLPVLKTKKAVDRGILELEIVGSSNVSRENVSKFVSAQGFAIEIVSDEPDKWVMIIKK